MVNSERAIVTTLNVSCYFRLPNSAHFLLQRGVAVDARDASARTPLHHALMVDSNYIESEENTKLAMLIRDGIFEIITISIGI